MARLHTGQRGQQRGAGLHAKLPPGARQVATQLDSVLPEVLRRFPYLSGEPARFIEQRLASAREAAANARFNPGELEVDISDDDEAAA